MEQQGSFNIFNTTLVASGQDLNGKFDVKAVSEQPDVTNWSPCWPNFGSFVISCKTNPLTATFAPPADNLI